jgi:streptogramin lyase
VNLNGDVAVANRNGGVAKFWANPDDCNGSNTSSGGADILAWDDEDCRAWYHDMACGSNRPVAWTRGIWSDQTCSYHDAKLWTVCDSQVLLLDGETGDTEQTVMIGAGAFVYGGAADADGNFWGLNFGNTSGIFRVDHEDYTVLEFPLPNQVGAYGITVDQEGRPWVCSNGVARFNLDTSTWSEAPGVSGGGGCMTDGVSTIWHGSFNGPSIVGVDTETLDVVHTIPVPQYTHGISIDFAGMVWGVQGSGSQAYRADPETNTVDTFTGLVGAYTYSDMTGFALSTAGGGGVPQN